MSMNFLKHFLATKAEDASIAGTDLLAGLDPKAVTEAAIRQKLEQSNERTKEVAAARAEFNREAKEAEEVETLYNRKLAAAERAQADLDRDPSNKLAEQALTELLDSIEKLVPRLEKEKKERDLAKAFLDQLETAAKEIADELKDLRATLTETQNSIREAELEVERNKKMAEKAQILAGLKKSGDKFDAAKNALQRQAEAKRQEAEALRLQVELLTTPPETVSSAAAAYLDDVTEAPKTETLSERLARLKK